jgi:peptidyl-prolyl cis-trans isomerase A (cyclophilin A)
MIFTFCLLLLPALLTGAQHPVVVLETGLGQIVIELYEDRAPVTVANFLKHVDGKAYDGGRFHRAVKMDNQPDRPIKIEVIQAGPNRDIDLKLPMIALERTSKTRLRHRDGTVSMARGAPDSATSDFFICIGDQPHLNYGGKRNPDGQGFAAFGKVTEGMDVVKKIQQSPAQGQRLTPPITILRAASR